MRTYLIIIISFTSILFSVFVIIQSIQQKDTARYSIQLTTESLECSKAARLVINSGGSKKISDSLINRSAFLLKKNDSLINTVK